MSGWEKERIAGAKAYPIDSKGKKAKGKLARKRSMGENGEKEQGGLGRWQKSFNERVKKKLGRLIGGC